MICLQLARRATLLIGQARQATDDDRRDPSCLPQGRARARSLPGLQTRWGALTSKKAPPHVPKNPLLRLLAYRLQATALDDLDPATLRYLERIVAAGKASPPVALPAPHALSPVPLLRRKWQGTLHQVEVVKEGLSWNGALYGSLSQAYDCYGFR